MAVALAAWVMSRAGRRRRAPRLAGAAAAFDSICRTFEERGHPRPPQRTPSEHLRALVREDELARELHGDLSLVVRAFERDRFAPTQPSEAASAEALDAARRVREAGTGKLRSSAGKG
jgi:hypothetical protein